MYWMRWIAAVTSWIVLIAAVSLGASHAAGAEELSEAPVDRREARKEWSRASNGKTEFELTDPTLVPKFFAAFARQSGCVYEPEMQQRPIRFVTINGHRLAIVFCRSGISGSDQVFDLSDLGRPKAVSFPIFAHPNGFGTTDRPGAIEYQKDAGIFLAEVASDYQEGQARHSYRFEDYYGFVVTRVEIKKDFGSPWVTIWEAGAWNLTGR